MLSMKSRRYKRQLIFSAASQKPNKKKNETMHYNDKEYIIYIWEFTETGLVYSELLGILNHGSAESTTLR